jgi:hypothetical protein
MLGRSLVLLVLLALAASASASGHYGHGLSSATSTGDAEMLSSQSAFSDSDSFLASRRVWTPASSAVRRTMQGSSPFQDLATLTELYLSVAAPTEVSLPATATAVLGPGRATYILASSSLQGKSVAEISLGDVDDGGHQAAQVSCSTPLSRSTNSPPASGDPILLGSQTTHLFTIRGQASLVIRAVTFVGCGRIVRLSDESSLSIISASFLYSSRILIASESAAVTMRRVSISNSTVQYAHAVAASSALGSDPLADTEARCRSISLVCLLNASTLDASGLDVENVGLAGLQPPDRQSMYAERLGLSTNEVVYAVALDRLKAMDSLLAGSLLVLRDNSAAVVVNSTVKQARAELGGAFYLNETARLDCSRCTLLLNSAEYAGGSIAGAGSSILTLRAGSTVESNSAIYGGAVWIQDSGTLRLLGGKITRCAASFAGGGVVAALQSSVELNNFTASSNSALMEGGFLLGMDRMAVHIMNGSTLTGNTAYFGGALSLITAVQLTMLNSTCERNLALAFGGCLRMFGRQSSAIFRGSLLRMNKATNGGFAAADRVNMTLDSVSCDANVASNTLSPELPNSVGGCLSSLDATVTIQDSAITNNSALDDLPSDDSNGLGGAMNLISSTVKILRSVFMQNRADGQGGGVRIWFTNTTIEDTLFYKNVARFDLPSPTAQRDRNYASGAGIHARDSNAVLTRVSVVENIADYVGGGVAIYSGSTLVVDSIFVGNVAVAGGGICIFPFTGGEEGILNLKQVRCFANQARFGGCVFGQLNVRVNISDMEASGNRAHANVSPFIQLQASMLLTYGGALGFLICPSVYIRNITVQSNSAQNYGGAIFSQDGNLTVDGALARGNSAAVGGFLFALRSLSNVTINRLTCVDNQVKEIPGQVIAAGGCICAVAIREMIIKNSLIARNTATGIISHGGGVVLQSSFRFIFENGTVNDCSSNSSGGGFYFEDLNSLTISSSAFNGNSDDVIMSTVMFSRADALVLAEILMVDCIFKDTRGASVNIINPAVTRAAFKRCKWSGTAEAVLVVGANEDTYAEIVDSQVHNATYGQLIWLGSLQDGVSARLDVRNTSFTSVAGRILCDNVAVNVWNSTFSSSKLTSGVSLFDITGAGRLSLSNVVFSDIVAIALVLASDSSDSSLRSLQFKGGNIFDRGIIWMTSRSAKVSAEDVSVTGVRSRCGIVACVEKAGSLTLTNMTIKSARCLPADPLLSYYAVDCAVVASTVVMARLSVADWTISDFDSWLIFSILSGNDSIIMENIRMAGSVTGGLLRVLSADGFGSVRASGISLKNFTSGKLGSPLRFEYVTLPTAPVGFSADISDLTADTGSVLVGSGGVVSLEPARFLMTGSAATEAKPGVRPFLVSMVNVSVANISAVLGGAMLHCSGPAWNLTLASASLVGLYSKTKGGAISLENGCALTIAKLLSSGSYAPAGGFASLSSAAVMDVRDALVQDSFAVGSRLMTSESYGGDFTLAVTRLIAAIGSQAESKRVAVTAEKCLSVLAALEELQASSRNQNDDGLGGVIRMDGGAVARIVNTTFFRNFAIHSGGVIHTAGTIAGGRPSSISVANVSAFGNGAIKGGIEYAQIPSTEEGTRSFSVPWGDASNFNCAQFGPALATSPFSLRALFTGSSYAVPTDAGRFRVQSGETLPEISVTVLDGLTQKFEDASFFSLNLVVGVRLKSGAPSANASLTGATGAIGVFGAAVFPKASIRILGPPGRVQLWILSDDLFADYPSSRLAANMTVEILPCPAGRFVSAESLACVACPVGQVNTVVESRSCTQLPQGFFSLDGATSMPCSDSIGNLNGSELEQAMSVKRLQCGGGGVSVQNAALGGGISGAVVAIGGILGVVYYQRRLREAQRTARPWLISSKEIQWIRQIGQGAFGEVFLCKYRETIVCVKRMRGSSSAKPANVNHASTVGRARPQDIELKPVADSAAHSKATATVPRGAIQGTFDATISRTRTATEVAEIMVNESALEDEIKIHVTLLHPNIVMCMGAVIEKGKVCLMTEFMHLGG